MRPVTFRSTSIAASRNRNPLRRSASVGILLTVLTLWLSSTAWALDPTNVLVLVNTRDPASMAVANHYRKVRRIPDANFVYLSYSGNAISCSWAEFEREIYHPALDHIRANGLQQRIKCWVTTRSLPYRVEGNSISWAIYAGRPLASTRRVGPADFDVVNAYFDRMIAFPAAVVPPENPSSVPKPAVKPAPQPETKPADNSETQAEKEPETAPAPTLPNAPPPDGNPNPSAAPGPANPPGSASSPASAPAAEKATPTAPPPTDYRPGFLHMMLESGSLEGTYRVIDRSAASDGSFPNGTVFLLDGDGPRSSRMISIPITERMMHALGAPVQHLQGSQLFDYQGKPTIGVMTGTVRFSMVGIDFQPGALGDHLTSFGGRLLEKTNQMTALEWLQNGCSASYGTVVEPYNYWQKFPTAKLHLYYRLGFSAAESYWMSVLWPQQGVFVGDPLARPFGDPPKISIQQPRPGQEVSGNFSLDAVVQASKGAGISRIEIFLDDRPTSVMAQNALPQGTTVDVAIGKRRVSFVLDQPGDLDRLIRGLRVQLVREQRIQSIHQGDSLLIVGPGGTLAGEKIQVTSYSPLVTAEAVTPTVLKGTPQPLAVDWSFSGTAKAKDEIEFVLEENEKAVATVKAVIPVDIPAPLVAARVVHEIRSQLPKGYKVSLISGRPGNPVTQVAIAAEPDSIDRVPRLKMTLKQAEGSTLTLAPQDAYVRFADPSMETMDLGWIRFGFGVPEVKLNTQVSTAAAADGRHELRIVAYRGRASQPASFAVVPFVVRNGKGRLTLAPVPNAVQSTGPPVVVAEARLENVVGGMVEFLVDGRLVATSNKPPHRLTLDGAAVGMGSHRIAARLAPDPGKTESSLFSDNVLEIHVDP